MNTSQTLVTLAWNKVAASLLNILTRLPSERESRLFAALTGEKF